MQEYSETQCWLEFCIACKYIDKTCFESLDFDYEKILSMLNSMEKKVETFCF